jgi:Pyridoxamine 5'-phosphate oxidase
MGVLTQDMRDILASAMLAFVATVRRDGSPSLSPKASTMPYDDDHLLFVDIASPQTIANLRNDPRIEINSVDFIRRRGYRFAGSPLSRYPVEAKGLSLPFGVLPRMGQKEEPRCVGRESRRDRFANGDGMAHSASRQTQTVHCEPQRYEIRPRHTSSAYRTWQHKAALRSRAWSRTPASARPANLRSRATPRR